jgi:hypothetical protein
MLIRFDFVGGPKDGESILDLLDDRRFGAAGAYYHATHGGAPGTLLWCRTEYLIELTQMLSESALRDLHENGAPLRGHLYEIFSRSRGDMDILVRARHVGAVPDGVPTRSTANTDQIVLHSQSSPSFALPDPEVRERSNQ